MNRNSELKDFFTPLQTQKLLENGIKNIYEFVTYLPFDIEQIKPLSRPFYENITYLVQASLIGVEHRKRSKNFLVLNFTNPELLNFSVYSFQTARWLLKELVPGGQFQLLVSFQNNFLVLKKISTFKSSSDFSKAEFKLGGCKIQEYFLPKYTKLGFLNSGYLQTLHSRLPDFCYALNLKGLISPELGLNDILDLKPIHKILDKGVFWKQKRAWQTVQVFLKLSLVNYLEQESQMAVARLGKIDLAFLKQLSANLPFELSVSQKTAVWEILKDLCEPQK